MNNKGAGQNRNMSDREKAILIERQRAINAKRARKRKQAIEKISAVFVFGCIGAFVCLAVIFAYIFFDFRSSEKPKELPVVVEYPKENTASLSDEDYFTRDGLHYVSLTKIAKICSFTLHGNVENMTLSIGNDKYASFDIGTHDVNVCGTYSLMSGKSYFEKGHLFIPANFFKDFCDGVNLAFTDDSIDITFSDKFTFKNSIPYESKGLIYSDVAMSMGNDSPIFKADLSDYEMYMNPEDRDEYLTLINTQSMLSSSYVPEDLTNIRDTRKDGRATQKMRLYAAKSLEAMFIEMRANGITDVSVTSGYRSYAYQKELFDNEVALFGGDVEKAKSQVAVPGSSEHQSGLCIDMHNLSSASEAFSQQAAYKWLYSNCANFGFILRFPKDKTDITGIIYEPWHYRYVGRYHAQRIMNSGLCLEEYIEQSEF